MFFDSLKKIPAYAEVSDAVSKRLSPIYLSGASHSGRVHLISGLVRSSSDSVLVICDTEAAALRFCDDLNVLLGANTAGNPIAAHLPAKDLALLSSEAVSKEYEHRRIGTLSCILSGLTRVICASAESLMQVTIPPEILKENTLCLKKGGVFDVSELTRRLLSAGYVSSLKVEGTCQFCRRGEVFDIFPVGGKFPVRLEFWGDEIDTIALFDPETQRRTDELTEITVPPAREVLFPDAKTQIEKLQALASKSHGKRTELIRKHLKRDIEMVENLSDGVSAYVLPDMDKYIPLAYEKPATLFDYLSRTSLVVFAEFHNIQSSASNVYSLFREDISSLIEQGELCKGLDGYLKSFDEIVSYAERFTALYMDSFLRGGGKTFAKLINAHCGQTALWSGEISALIDDLQNFTERGYIMYLLAGSEKTVPIVVSDIQNAGINAEILTENSVLKPGTVYVTFGALSGGFDWTDAKIALISQSTAVSSKRRTGTSKKRAKSEEILSLSDIQNGDLVVHSVYGIGRFGGIRKIEIEGVTKDYITIKYDGTDVLYVPVNQLDLVSKYIGPRDNDKVRLSKLSGGDWAKRKARVRQAVKDMADDLIKLYAKRAQTPGYAFPADDDLQNDFESRFPFSETDDQLQSAAEIKNDMETRRPMDRLLCGDVGFGKTEVAFRAAFKCVETGKQCVFLAPTTVLAWQHYQSALTRFEGFGIRIALLSRFLSARERTDVRKKLADGKVDLIIGTHMLVQKGVKFADLGLVIIDEEQRFGVAHKEKFKEIFSGVDVLTLSATPIPRTLNMAMSGIRDMSVLEEAPVDRHPVQTFVIEYDTGVLVQSLRKELRRGGQAFYIHNRVETIAKTAANLSDLLPEAVIGIAHGQMDEDELSEIWRKLIEREIDILVCTTLIETGVDVPNCNTLIIEDADRFGLSQLYQLRGRVGRSSRRAYAYFTFRRGKALTEIATRRLEAIREFTQFGSGFRIAMRDLELRGAGSLLGANQHGHMDSVGYDMYLKILSDVMAEQKGEAPAHRTDDCLVDLKIEAHIPEEYIPSLADRLDIYRKIAAIRNDTDAEDLYDELIDRFGDPPKAIEGLVTVALVRSKAASLTITEITERGGAMYFYLKECTLPQIQNLVMKFKHRVNINGGEKSYIAVTMGKETHEELMKCVIGLLTQTEVRSQRSEVRE
ncbi:MAG: transcription-repair coupling factor [Ruminococcus sp.]|jgi:transcription-repair coupling factor (superfamily II helicase)|nr:transcription-repair coupling factor [Ruminococcus sp.]